MLLFLCWQDARPFRCSSFFDVHVPCVLESLAGFSLTCVGGWNMVRRCHMTVKGLDAASFSLPAEWRPRAPQSSDQFDRATRDPATRLSILWWHPGPKGGSPGAIEKPHCWSMTCCCLVRICRVSSASKYRSPISCGSFPWLRRHSLPQGFDFQVKSIHVPARETYCSGRPLKLWRPELDADSFLKMAHRVSLSCLCTATTLWPRSEPLRRMCFWQSVLR